MNTSVTQDPLDINFSQRNDDSVLSSDCEAADNSLDTTIANGVAKRKRK